MEKLGWKYCRRKKSFCVDGHEQPAQKLHRKEFCEKYLGVWEPRMYWWIKIDKQELLTLKEQNEISKNVSSYEYIDASGLSKVEMHIDTCEWTSKKGNEHEFGGNLSIRKNVSLPLIKPIIIICQDKCVFIQYLLGKSQWVGPSGHRVLLPKTDGLSVMICAFQSCELGFDLKLLDNQLEKVNALRCKKIYIDKKQHVKYLALMRRNH